MKPSAGALDPSAAAGPAAARPCAGADPPAAVDSLVAAGLPSAAAWAGPLAATALAGVLAACSNAPVRYYTLSPAPGTAVAIASGHFAPVRVGRVSIPVELDRRGLTHHTSPDQLNVSDSDLWAASLPDLIRKTVTADLGQRLGYERVLSPDSGSVAGGESTLALDFSSLSADEKCSVSARVYWTFYAPNQPLQHATTALSQTAAACPAGLPAALTQLLGRLSDELAPRLAAAATAASATPTSATTPAATSATTPAPTPATTPAATSATPPAPTPSSASSPAQ